MSEQFKHAIDGLTISGVVSSFFGWLTLPNLAFVIPIIWWLIRIYETKSFQKLVQKVIQKWLQTKQ